MDAATAKAIPQTNNEVDIVPQHIKPATPEVPPEIQTIITAHEEYQSYSTNFAELESATAHVDDVKYQQPPWKDIKKKVDRDIQQTGYIINRIDPTKALTPEERGAQLFKIRGKFNREYQQHGAIRAEQHGTCIVMVCDNEEDFKVLSNNEKTSEVTGDFTHASYALPNPDGRPTIMAQIPTITALATEKSQATIDHEKGHYRLETYMKAAKANDYATPAFEYFRLNEAFDTFRERKTDKASLTTNIQNFVKAQRVKAVEEFLTETFAQGKVDYRNVYQDYFTPAIRGARPLGSEISDIVGLAQREFSKEIQKAKEKYDRATQFLINSGLPADEAYLSLGLSLMTADERQFTQALNGFDLIQRISINQDMSDLSQDFNQHKQSLDMDAVTATFTHAVTETQAGKSFGLKQAIQSGMSLPEALREATKNREHFLELTKPIQVQIDRAEQQKREKAQQRSDQREAEEHRGVIAEEIANKALATKSQPTEIRPTSAAKPKENPMKKILGKLAAFGRR